MIKLAIITNPLLPTDSQLLDTLLAQCGIQSAQCLKLCVTTPDLAEQLGAFAPFCCLLLGDKPLHLFAGGKRSLKDWRGYVWRAATVAPGTKCVAAWAMDTLRLDFGLTGEQRFYFQRAAREARSGELVVPTRNVGIAWPGKTFGDGIYCSKQMAINSLQAFQADKKLLSVDIEGGAGMGPACVGFAWDAHHALVIPFYDVDGRSIWNEEDEIELWGAVEAVLEDPLVPKTLQNALFEAFVKGWSAGICLCGIVGDTMLKHFELYAELDKSLEYQAALYTQQPFWKLTHREVEGRYVPFKDGRRATTEEWLVYNGTDCCVTYEIDRVLETRLAPRQKEHYLFNVSLLVPLAYMSLRGFRYDKDEAARMLAETQQRIYELQDQINQEAASSPAKAELRSFFEALGVVIPPTGTQRPVQSESVTSPDGAVGEALGVRLCGGGEAGGSGAGAAVAGPDDTCSTSGVAGRAGCPTGPSPELHESGEGGASDVRTAKLLPLFTAAFCQARRTEAREVEEVTWQPHAWNGKRWVRNGKRLTKLLDDMGEVHEGDEEPANTTWDWLKPVRKLVTRNVPVAISSLADVRRFSKDSCLDDCKRALQICRALEKEAASPAQRGELATLLGLSININSTSQGGDAQWLLYEHWGLTPQYAKDGPRLTDKLTTDAEAAIKAYLGSGKDDSTRDQRALTFLSSRWHDTQAETLAAECDDDGRIRCSYNLVGTETHRLSCSTSATGSGYNLQTVTKKLRHLFKADEGCYLCQRDLSGADGWTVAAYAAALGDPNMLEDYRAKLKPAQIIVLMLERGAAVNQLTRDELRPLCKPITEETDWRYFAMKRGQHGWCYLMGDKMTSDQILTDSFKKDGKPVSMPADQMRRIRDTCFFVRYPGIQRWHEDSAQRLMADGKLTASNGFTRQFFGRKADFTKGRGGEWIKKPNRQTLGEWLAHLPQVYTTYATTLALHHLWTDPTNRRPDGSLVVEPIHTVHDSLITQWRIEDTEWAKGKQREWFENEILIANEKIVIPASGTYGPSWGEQEFNLT